MSAICGALGRTVRSGNAGIDLNTMLAALQERGPDGSADYRDRTEPVMLGFRFLQSAPGEANPAVLSNEDGNLRLVCDGHVFNHLDLRPQLEAKGHVFKHGHSAETLLHLYEEEGIDGLRRIDGQFAAAIWDQRRKQLLLIRDFLGVRPLYYWSGPEGLVFSSAIKSLLRHSSVTCSLDETAVSQFLTFTSVPGPRTLFRGIQKLQAGTVAICRIDGSVTVKRYWEILDQPIADSDDENFYVNGVRERHFQSVKRRQVEGPIGSLLSGGNDSSANAALLARYGSNPLHTFTVGLADLEGNEKYNDLYYARKVAEVIHSDHHEHLLSTDEFLAAIPRTIDAMEDVVSEPSSIFLYHALRLAKDQGLRTVITGEANDELCCGHGGMIHIRDGYYSRWLPYLQKPALARKAIAAAAPIVSSKRRDILSRAASGEEYFWSYETAWMDTEKRNILEASIAARTGKAADVVRGIKQRFDASGHAHRDYLFYIIYSMTQDFYFGNLMLGKLDSLASSLSLEARCPYTEPSYAHFVYNVPAKFKTRDGVVKYFFKKAIEGVLPNEIIYRPKQGFRTPVVELFQGALGKWAEPILMETGLTREGLLRRSHLADLLNRHRRGEADYANRLWTAMTLNLWFDRWIRGNDARDSQSALVGSHASA